MTGRKINLVRLRERALFMIHVEETKEKYWREGEEGKRQQTEPGES